MIFIVYLPFLLLLLLVLLFLSVFYQCVHDLYCFIASLLNRVSPSMQCHIAHVDVDVYVLLMYNSILRYGAVDGSRGAVWCGTPRMIINIIIDVVEVAGVLLLVLLLFFRCFWYKCFWFFYGWAGVFISCSWLMYPHWHTLTRCASIAYASTHTAERAIRYNRAQTCGTI